MLLALALTLSSIKHLIPFYVYRKIGLNLRAIPSATILGLCICIIPLARSISRFLVIYSANLDESLTSFYLRSSLIYDLIYSVCFLSFFGFLIRLKLLKFFIPFVHIKRCRRFFLQTLRFITVNTSTQLFYFALSILFLVVLIILSSAHFIWLTNPRLAYIEGRSGVGPIFILFIFFTNLSSYYLAKSHFTSHANHHVKCFTFKYIYRLFLTLFLSFFTGTKSVTLSIVATQLVSYLAYSPLTIKSLVNNLFRHLRLHILVIITIIVAFLSLVFVLKSLSGTVLSDYISETPFFVGQIEFVKTSSGLSVNYLNQFYSVLMLCIPPSVLELLNLPQSPLIQYTASVLNVNPEFMVNFPAIDTVMFSQYLLGPFFFIIAITSAFASSLPFASLYRLCSATQSQYKSLDHIFLICSFALSYLPLVEPLVSLNLFSLLALK